MLDTDSTALSDSSTPITVGALTLAIKSQLESQFHHLSVQGEISNLKPHSSGHLYFDLKDAEAKIAAVLFRSLAIKLQRAPKEGDQVIVHGELSVYPPHGKYQLLARSLEYQGVGALLLKFEQLKTHLQQLGWFDLKHKKPLPSFPRTIGVITSPTGAVIRDIIHILSKRFPGFHLLLNPVRVQGIEAAAEIAQAIEQCNRYQLADVLIVGRGGGSLEDLWPFNEQIVAKAIFESRIPIVSAVGHETDFTLADFVADLRAPTPSAAATLVISEKRQYLDVLKKTASALRHSILQELEQLKLRLALYQKAPLFATSYTLLAFPFQKLDEMRGAMDRAMQQHLLKKRYLLMSRARESAALKPTAQLLTLRTQTESYRMRLQERFQWLLSRKREQITTLREQLHAVDPKQVLKRGYCILFAEKAGSVVVSSRGLEVGERVHALLSDGEVHLTVDELI